MTTKPLGIGVIGAGILGTRHARVFAELSAARLVAVSDTHDGRADEVASRHGARAFRDHREMLFALGPSGSGEIAAAAVATPDFAHHDVVCDCLSAGLDVLVEKPLAMSVAEARSMISLARERGRVLMVNYSQRWLPENRRIEELFRDGTLGSPAFIESHRWDAAWVPERMITWSARTTPIHFMSSHDIDLIVHWLGDRVESVSAFAHHGALAEARGLSGVVDGYVALLRFRAGTVVSLHSTWIVPDTFPAAADTYLEVLGSRGAVWLNGNARQLRFYGEHHSEQVTYGGPVTATEVNGRIEGAFTESLKSFLAAVAGRDVDAPASAERTLHVVEIQEAIVRAAKSRDVVTFGGDVR
jgi:predicted dehydrogenase